MKFNNIFKMFLVLVVLVSTSCKDFLDQPNPNELTVDQYFNSLSDENAALNATYATLYDNDIWGAVYETLRSDMGVVSRAFGGGDFRAVMDQAFTNVTPYVANKWAGLYKGVFRANQVLSTLEKVKIVETDSISVRNRLQIEAQAKLLRGAFHFWLMHSFNGGNVIVFDFLPVNPDDYRKKASSREEVLAAVKKDLEFAADPNNKLPATWTNANDVGRVTLGVANALLGQLYLYEKDYEKASTYFTKVINGPYSLVADGTTLSTGENDLSSEAIFEVNYSTKFKQDKTGGQTTSGSTATNIPLAFASAGYPGGFRTVMPAYLVVMAYKNEKMDATDARNFTTVNGVKVQNPYSIRCRASIAIPDDGMLYYQQKTYYAPFNNNEPAYFRKFTQHKTASSENDDKKGLQRSGINFPIIRLADIYLMQAEALIKGGTSATTADLNNALRFVNRVRKRWGLQLLGLSTSSEFPTSDHDGVTYTAQSLMDFLMYNERPLELALEGMAGRAIDMRRWGIQKQRLTELSLIPYRRDAKTFVDADKNNASRQLFGAILRYPTAAELANTTIVMDFDHRSAASNFIESVHAYWPVPAVELTSNKNF